MGKLGRQKKEVLNRHKQSKELAIKYSLMAVGEKDSSLGKSSLNVRTH